ncbi:triose-phosphate isomerase family protein [Streptomyces noursei]|uniref:triose-phosphate isomerase family protein n=1 Tax=Streptomyces noursei TaxID=1971 RepID=UPI0033FABC53
MVGVSLKLYFGLARTRAWLTEVAALDAVPTSLPRPVDLFVLPSLPALADARELLSGTRIGYGAQDVHWAEQGAWTREVSAGMLVETGARYVEVGHAERRRHFGETDETVPLAHAPLIEPLSTIVRGLDIVAPRLGGHGAPAIAAVGRPGAGQPPSAASSVPASRNAPTPKSAVLS